MKKIIGVGVLAIVVVVALNLNLPKSNLNSLYFLNIEALAGETGGESDGGSGGCATGNTKTVDNNKITVEYFKKVGSSNRYKLGKIVSKYDPNTQTSGKVLSENTCSTDCNRTCDPGTR